MADELKIEISTGDSVNQVRTLESAIAALAKSFPPLEKEAVSAVTAAGKVLSQFKLDPRVTSEVENLSRTFGKLNIPTAPIAQATSAINALGNVAGVTARQTRTLQQGISSITSAATGVTPAVAALGNAVTAATGPAVKQVNLLGQSFVTLRQLIGGLGISLGVAGITQFGVAAIEAARSIDKAKSGIAAVTGDAKSAEVQFTKLVAIAQKYGVSLSTLSSEYGKFAIAAKTAGVSNEEINKSFENIVKAARGLNLSGEQVGGVIRALSQSFSKGKIQAEELTGQLGDRLPVALTALGQTLGKTNAETLELVKAGKVGSEVIPEFTARLAELAKVGTELNSKGIDASIERINNAITQLLSSFGQGAFEGISNQLKNVFEGVNLTSLQASFKDIGTSVGETLGFIVRLGAGVVDTFSLIGTAANGVFGILSVVFRGITDAVTAALAVFKPLTDAFTQITGISVGTTDAVRGLGAILGVLAAILVGNAIASGIGFIVTQLGLITVGAGTATASLFTLRGALTVLTGPVGAVVGVLTVLGIGLAAYKTSASSAAEATDKLKKKNFELGDAYKTLVNDLGKYRNSIAGPDPSTRILTEQITAQKNAIAEQNKVVAELAANRGKGVGGEQAYQEALRQSATLTQNLTTLESKLAEGGDARAKATAAQVTAIDAFNVATTSLSQAQGDALGSAIAFNNETQRLETTSSKTAVAFNQLAEIAGKVKASGETSSEAVGKLVESIVVAKKPVEDLGFSFSKLFNFGDGATKAATEVTKVGTETAKSAAQVETASKATETATTNVTTKVAALNTAIDASAKSTGTFAGNLTTLALDAKKLGDSVTVITTALKSLGEATGITTLATAFGGLLVSITALTAPTKLFSDNLALINTNLTTIPSNLTTTNTALATFSTSLPAVNALILPLVESFNQLKLSTPEVSNAMTSFGLALTAISTALPAVLPTLATFTTTLETAANLAVKIESLGTALANVSLALTKLAPVITPVSDAFVKLGEGADKSIAAFNTFPAAATNVVSGINTITQSIEALIAKINEAISKLKELAQQQSQGGGGGGDTEVVAPGRRDGGLSNGGASSFSTVSASAFTNAPQLRTGIDNTNKLARKVGDGIPTILHPNEAVVPLPNGRSIPVEFATEQQTPDITGIMRKISNTIENAVSAFQPPQKLPDFKNASAQIQPGLANREVVPITQTTSEPIKSRDQRENDEASDRTPARGKANIILNMTVNTADAESFKRSQSQIKAELFKTAQSAFKRNG